MTEPAPRRRIDVDARPAEAVVDTHDHDDELAPLTARTTTTSATATRPRTSSSPERPWGAVPAVRLQRAGHGQDHHRAARPPALAAEATTTAARCGRSSTCRSTSPWATARGRPAAARPSGCRADATHRMGNSGEPPGPPARGRLRPLRRGRHRAPRGRLHPLTAERQPRTTHERRYAARPAGRHTCVSARGAPRPQSTSSSPSRHRDGPSSSGQRSRTSDTAARNRCRAPHDDCGACRATPGRGRRGRRGPARPGRCGG